MGNKDSKKKKNKNKNENEKKRNDINNYKKNGININEKYTSYKINIDKNIEIDEKIENYELKAFIKDERCITSFTIIKNNKILITYRGGLIKLYEFILDKNNQNYKFIEIIRFEGEEYCFNYGIELHNGNLAICSEDSTIQIIELNDDKINDKNKNKNVDKNKIEDKNNDKKFKIVQTVDLNDEPLYLIKQLMERELVLGGWNFIFVYTYVASINKFELISKVQVEDRTFSLIELYKDVIVSSQCYSKQLTIYNIITCEREIIKNIESNENPNILCKYDFGIIKKDIILFVASDKGISIVSINKKCLIYFIQLNEEVSSICPFIATIKDKKNNKNENFSLLCGIKKRVYGQSVNYYYNLLQIGILFNKDKNKDKKKDKNDNNNYNISIYIISEKERAQLNIIKEILNTRLFSNVIMNSNEQMFLTCGTEDKRLHFWMKEDKKINNIKNKNKKKIENNNLYFPAFLSETK